jgi:hypothetical protein
LPNRQGEEDDKSTKTEKRQKKQNQIFPARGRRSAALDKGTQVDILYHHAFRRSLRIVLGSFTRQVDPEKLDTERDSIHFEPRSFFILDFLEKGDMLSSHRS